MTNSLDEFRKKFQVDDLAIITLEHWTWSVRPVHSTLGSGILSLNRYATSFGSITPDESAELGVIAGELEQRLHNSFSPDKFNYIMLMMVDKHLHFHVIPRYATSREFSSITWSDAGWPGQPQMSNGQEFSSHPVLVHIRDSLRKS